MRQVTPRLGRWLLALVCEARDRPYVLSDLDEEFERLRATAGEATARRWYRLQVRTSLLPLAARRLGPLGAGIAGRRRTAIHSDRRRVQPRLRGAPGGRLVSDSVRDLGLAIRTLRRSPLVVLTTVISLAIGIGASTSVFTLANAFLFRGSTGLTDTERLLAVYTSDERGNLYRETSFPDYETLVEEADAFEGVTAYRAGFVTLTEVERSERMLVEIVSGNYFEVLGIRVAPGRPFLEEETRLGSAEPVIVIGHELWMERFGGDPGAVGRTLRLDGRDFTIIGVAPEKLLGRTFRLKVDGWVPVGIPGGTYHATPQEIADRRDRDYGVMARLRVGVTRAQAEGQLAVLADRLREEYPEAWVDDRGDPRRFSLLREAESQLPPDGRAALASAFAAFLGGTLLILLLACSNVASLFLARAHGRRREMAVRLSLGAGRGRLMRLLLSESLVLGLAGGAVGVLLAWSASGFMDSLPLPTDVPIAFDLGLDWRVVGFALGVSLLAAMVFGMAPALQGSRSDVVPSLKSEAGTEGGKPGRMGLRSFLVTAQIAGSLTLLVAAGLFLRSLQATASVDLGLNPVGIALVSKDLDPEIGPEEGTRYFLDLADRLAASPEIEDVQFGRVAEASVWGSSAYAKIQPEGWESEGGESPVVAFNSVTPGYLEMLEIAILRGRGFTAADVPGAPHVAVVNESFVRRYFAEGPVLGARFTVLEERDFDTPTGAPSRVLEVVGVVRDLEPMEPGAAPAPFFWTAFRQDYSPRAVIHAKGRGGAEPLVPILRREVASEAGEVALIAPTTYAELVRLRTLLPRVASRLLGIAGLFALALAVVGIYGLVSFTVSQRSREMAIRQAMGARSDQVVGAVVRRGLLLAAVGIGVGLVVVVPGALLLRSTLHGITPLDPLALGGGVGVLLLAALVASWLPARRVSRVRPMQVLREG